MAATLSASPSFASHCATTRSPPRSTASLMVFPSTAYRPMLMSPWLLGSPLALDRPARGADPSMASEPCDKRFDQCRSVIDGFDEKQSSTFSRHALEGHGRR